MLQRSIFCVLMASFFASCSETSNTTAKANILVPEVIDKGNVYDSTLIDSIEIKNIGQPDLKILQVEPGCSCSVSSFDSLPITAGKNSFIRFTIHLSDTGFFQKNFVIEANTDSVFHVVNVRGHFSPKKL